MSDAVRCAECGYVYWVGSMENWGTCLNCHKNNDFAPIKPRLVSCDNIHQFMSEDELRNDPVAQMEAENLDRPFID